MDWKEVPHVTKETKFSKHGTKADMLVLSQGGADDAILTLLYDPKRKEDALNCSDSSGNTPLHLAAIGNRPETIRILLEIGKMDVNVQNSNNETALHHAAERGNLAALEALLEYDADPNLVENIYMETALHKASWEGHHLCIIPLIKAKACKELKDRDGCVARDLAEINRKHQVSAVFEASDTAAKLLHMNLLNTRKR
eukprot:CAMPEP_0184532448 /NCGR_PEP_ID=MMETSP0198_2-20121128/14172_1 /TAXON_ID=1112570 /ORGANISM="Thraustochytrium sp., Strain LLF1b" /LENGTH=197 /DNA_ID=CAMNT_0026925045 /DNA_START=195 /DNA_END=788 /DNA_ORIENTATION=-